MGNIVLTHQTCCRYRQSHRRRSDHSSSYNAPVIDIRLQSAYDRCFPSCLNYIRLSVWRPALVQLSLSFCSPRLVACFLQHMPGPVSATIGAWGIAFRCLEMRTQRQPYVERSIEEYEPTSDQANGPTSEFSSAGSTSKRALGASVIMEG